MKRDIQFVGVAPSVHALTHSRTLWTIVLACVAILAAFWQTAGSIVAIWIRSETFAHGFVIIPLCIWLAFRRRDALATVDMQPWWPGVAFVFAAGALWFVGAKADANVVQQFALAFMLQATIVTIIGIKAARVLAFPLSFLLFAVPFGEFCVPTLMDWTADATIMALRATGIPVYREANHFIIPSGSWSVVEGCSGIRYVIASVMIGTIYASVAYRSVARRALFVAASVVVPVIANWMRAYLIVMIAHLSSMRLATGIDHIIYGWIFFGLVMLLLFWIGSFWQEPAPASALPFGWRIPTRTSDARAMRPQIAAACVALALAAIWLPIEAVVGREVQGNPVVPPIAASAGWTNVPIVDDTKEWTPRYTGFATTLRQRFAKDGREVGIYVAYYRHQEEGHRLVTSINMLTEPNNWQWHLTSTSPEAIAWGSRALKADRSVIVGTKERLEALSFFWVGGRVTASAYEAKVLQAIANVLGGGDDAALVVMYTTKQDAGDAATRTLDEFARAMSPSIEAALAKARDSGR
ncbi:MAG TPA: exosortase A [Casimicrobiaceae bacterium]